MTTEGKLTKSNFAIFEKCHVNGAYTHPVWHFCRCDKCLHCLDVKLRALEYLAGTTQIRHETEARCDPSRGTLLPPQLCRIFQVTSADLLCTVDLSAIFSLRPSSSLTGTVKCSSTTLRSWIHRTYHNLT